MPKGQFPSAELQAVPLTARGERHAGFSKVQQALRRFGYLAVPVATDTLDDPTAEALAKYQAFHRLTVTGVLDEPTKQLLVTPRCALPDLDNGAAFSVRCAWQIRTLRFAFDTDTVDLPAGNAFAAVRRAFNTWSAVVPLTFREVGTSQTPEIQIGWRPAADPDLSMVGTVIAHSDFPPGCSVVNVNGLPKPLHFDDSETLWVNGSAIGGLDVESVALHEIGHLIGLNHSSVPGAVMLPTISSNTTLRALSADDIAGARALYPRGFVSAFVANNATNDLLVAASDDGVAWSNNTRINQSSHAAPSLARFNGRLWMAFVADNASNDLLVASSADGFNWSGNTRTGQSSKFAPALTVFGGQLRMAFVADNGSNDLLVASSGDGTTWSANTRVGQSSQNAPALAEFNGQLRMAFVANNGSNQLLTTSSADGVNWSGNVVVNQSCHFSPSLAVFGGQLQMAFVANNGTNSLLIVSSGDGTTWGRQRGVSQASRSAPALAAYKGQLQMVFAADNGTGDLLVVSSPDSVVWSANTRMNQSTKLAPGCAVMVA